MNTKLDFKIQYEVIGQGEMIYSPRQIGEWWVMPESQYQGNIPPEIQRKKAEFLNSGVEVVGFLIAEDMENRPKPKPSRFKPELKPLRRPDPLKPKVKPKDEFGSIFGLLRWVVVGAFRIAFLIVSLDPMLIAVLPDGRWICLGTWYD